MFSFPQTLVQQVLTSVNTRFEIQKADDAFLLEVNEIEVFMFPLASSHMILELIERREYIKQIAGLSVRREITSTS